MLVLDGSMGEGGGQILRTGLALSLVTGKPFRIEKIRAGRKVPGLRPQHVAAVRAAATIGKASLRGDSVGSLELAFTPGKIEAGSHTFSVGTAGSATLVFQTVLPALLRTEGTSWLSFEGGTHNPLAPPFDFIERAFLPVLARMGPRVTLRLDRHGFYPAGGGRFSATVEPAPLARLDLEERGALRSISVVAAVSRLPESIATRELETVASVLGSEGARFTTKKIEKARSPGNYVAIDIECDHATEVVSAIGERGVPAEEVARKAAHEAREYLDSGAAVGQHLADQLLIPIALAGEGAFTTLAPTPHTRTQAEVVEKFLGSRFALDQVSEKVWRISLGR